MRRTLDIQLTNWRAHGLWATAAVICVFAFGAVEVAGAKDQTKVFTEAVTTSGLGASESKSLTVPGFGGVDLSCNASGVPSVILHTAGEFVVFDISRSFASAFATGSYEIPPTTSIGSTVWVTLTGGAVWKIDFIMTRVITITPGFIAPCVAGVTVTPI